MNILLVLLASLVLSGCQGLDLIPDVSPSGGGPEQSKKFLVDALNYWLGKPKEERVRVFGAPSQCAKVKDTQERCEWKKPTQQIVFLYDSKGIARSWSYRGDFGQFNNANHEMVKAQPVSSKPSQQATEWVHPTKAKEEYPQAMLECQSQIMNDPTNTSINTVRGPISGGKVQNQVLIDECLRKNGWVQK